MAKSSKPSVCSAACPASSAAAEWHFAPAFASAFASAPAAYPHLHLHVDLGTFLPNSRPSPVGFTRTGLLWGVPVEGRRQRAGAHDDSKVETSARYSGQVRTSLTLLQDCCSPDVGMGVVSLAERDLFKGAITPLAVSWGRQPRVPP